jgi:hypothetical protein
MGLKFLDEKKETAPQPKACFWLHAPMGANGQFMGVQHLICPACEVSVSPITGKKGCMQWSNKLGGCIIDIALRRIAEAKPGSVITLGEN